jgi:hypothetical protein
MTRNFSGVSVYLPESLLKLFYLANLLIGRNTFFPQRDHPVAAGVIRDTLDIVVAAGLRRNPLHRLPLVGTDLEQNRAAGRKVAAGRADNGAVAFQAIRAPIESKVRLMTDDLRLKFG